MFLTVVFFKAFQEKNKIDKGYNITNKNQDKRGLWRVYYIINFDLYLVT